MTEATPTDKQGKVRVADLLIDLDGGTVSRDGVVIDLPDLSWRLLRALVMNAPDLLGKDRLIGLVWEDVVVSDETLAQRVRLLRQALSDGRKEDPYIASVRNRGYRLLPEVIPVASGAFSSVRSSRRWPWLALAIAVLLIAWFQLRQQPVPPPQKFRSVAVLPFADLSPASDSQYLADGLHEELLGRLAGVTSLDVVSRTSVLPYRDSQLPVPEIARQLGVDVLIEGSLRRSGDRLRLSVQIIDGHEDRHLWAENFDRELTLENLFEIQSEVAGAVARVMEFQLNGIGAPEMVALPTASLQAYKLYLLGRYNTFLLTRESLDTGVQLLRQAVELDPEFAEAWATLGWAYSFQGSGYGDEPPRDAFERAREAALRALSLDQDLADAHSLYADILTWYDWDWEAAEREYLATLERDPHNVLGYALFLSTQRRHDESLALVESLLQRFEGNTYYHVNAAWRYLNARDYASAIAQAERSGNHNDRLSVMGWALLESGQPEKAVAAFRQQYEADPENPARISDLAAGLARTGDHSGARELLERLVELSARRQVSPAMIAAVYFELRDADTAFEWMEKALRERSRGLIFLQVDHVYDGFRDDPRYLALSERLGFHSAGR